MSIERILSKSQGRAVGSMVYEREQIKREANQQIDEVNAALEEQASVLRAYFGLPEGEYIFEGRPEGIVLKMKPIAAPPDGGPESMGLPATPDGAEEATEALAPSDGAPEEIAGSAECEDANDAR